VAASVSPPVPGPVNDVRLARQAGVLGRLAEGDKARDRLIGRYRVVVGHPIAQPNRLTALRQVYRGNRLRYGQVLRAVAANRRLRVAPRKRYVTAA
jgi:hypothetical protein